VLVASPTSSQVGGGSRELTLRVETRLIEVNVVAQDSKGRAVQGLVRPDFQLFDNGKRVPIGVFSTASESSLSGLAPAAFLPNTFSNRMQMAPPSVTVILFDGLNTAFEDQVWARAELIRFIEGLKPGDRAAIFLLSDRLRILQTFTGDPALLLKVLRASKPRVPRELTSAIPTESDGLSSIAAPASRGPAAAEAREEAAIGQFERHAYQFYLLRDRVERTLSAMTAIGNYLAQFPGRKNLLWVSDAFPLAVGGGLQQLFVDDEERSVRALNNADMAVYPVAAKGLCVECALGWDASTSSGRFVPTAPCDPAAASIHYASLGTMKELADLTGGRAYYNTNGLTEAMRAAVDDSHANYTLGFYPHMRWDGQYHELKVKVTRPGVHLRYRKGYYATLDLPEGEGRVAELFDRAIYSPLDSTALGLTVSLQKITIGPPKRATFEIVMDPHDITFQDKNGDKTVQLEMLIAQLGADGKVLKSFRQDENLRIAARGMNQVLAHGLALGKWVGLVDGATAMEVVVRDPASGNLGSVRIPLAM
jgi:VWFA-related protein